MSLTRPDPFTVLWAEKGEKFVVPNLESEAVAEHKARASMETGFPAITMKSVVRGGVPPWGKDHNGILGRITQDLQWTQAGGLPSFNQELCNAIGGYPVGTILQTSDISKPWVLWINQQDGNRVDPNGLKLNSSTVEEGWRRYPVITGRDGSSLYYNSDGELDIFTAENTINKYVSWRNGNDSNNGTRDKPFKTIDMAIQKSPSTGQISIRILDTDDHYMIGQADVEKTNIYDYNPGKIYKKGDNIQTQPIMVLGGQIGVGIRSIIIQPYSDTIVRTDAWGNKIDAWDELINLAQSNTGDGWWGYCLSDEALASKGLRRPTIYKMWCYSYIYSEGEWVTSSIMLNGLSGVQGNFSIGFLGCRLKFHEFDKLQESPYNFANGFERVGGTYMYNGVIIDNLILNSQYDKYSFGGGDLANTNISFRRQNSFVDYTQGKDSVFIRVNAQINIAISKERQTLLPSTELSYIDNNSLDYLAKKASYSKETLDIIPDPSPHYAYININISVNK